MLRGLTHFWRVNVAVLLAAAINTAVLTGALIVGDSVRGSLRDMTLDRLGAIDEALVAERFFPVDLADRLAGPQGLQSSGRRVAPAILLPGSAVHGDTGARASRVNVHGIDARFVDFFPQSFDFARARGQIFPSAIINETLGRQLGAAPGDTILLNFRSRDNVPDDTLLGNKENTRDFGTIRATVREVLPDAGIGRFGLSPSQAFPPNAFVELDELGSALDQAGGANAILVSVAPDRAPASPPINALTAVLELDDLGLLTERHDGQLLVESSEYVLPSRCPRRSGNQLLGDRVDDRGRIGALLHCRRPGR